ncbi:hypothetical protein Pelo_836 [Pelomyxa schiedti]|nr:hypothetical protein Pelo_836 [Pelomyxa schiedti]
MRLPGEWSFYRCCLLKQHGKTFHMGHAKVTPKSGSGLLQFTSTIVDCGPDSRANISCRLGSDTGKNTLHSNEVSYCSALASLASLARMYYSGGKVRKFLLHEATATSRFSSMPITLYPIEAHTSIPSAQRNPTCPRKLIPSNFSLPEKCPEILLQLCPYPLYCRQRAIILTGGHGIHHRRRRTAPIIPPSSNFLRARRIATHNHHCPRASVVPCGC